MRTRHSVLVWFGACVAIAQVRFSHAQVMQQNHATDSEEQIVPRPFRGSVNLCSVMEFQHKQESPSFLASVVGMDAETLPKHCATIVEAYDTDLLLDQLSAAPSLDFGLALESNSFRCADFEKKLGRLLTPREQTKAGFTYLHNMKALEKREASVMEQYLGLKALAHSPSALPALVANEAFPRNQKKLNDQALACAGAPKEVRQQMIATLTSASELYLKLLALWESPEVKAATSQACSQLKTTGDHDVSLSYQPIIHELSLEDLSKDQIKAKPCKARRIVETLITEVEGSLPFGDTKAVQSWLKHLRRVAASTNPALVNASSPYGSDMSIAPEFVFDDALKEQAAGLIGVHSQVQSATLCLQGLDADTSCYGEKVLPLLKNSMSQEVSMAEFLGEFVPSADNKSEGLARVNFASELQAAGCRAGLARIREDSKDMGFDVVSTVASLGVGAAIKGAQLGVRSIQLAAQAGEASRVARLAQVLKGLPAGKTLAGASRMLASSRSVAVGASGTDVAINGRSFVKSCFASSQPSITAMSTPSAGSSSTNACTATQAAHYQIASQSYLRCVLDTVMLVIPSVNLRMATRTRPAYSGLWAGAKNSIAESATVLESSSLVDRTERAKSLLVELAKTHAGVVGIKPVTPAQLAKLEAVLKETAQVGRGSTGKHPDFGEAGVLVHSDGKVTINYSMAQLEKMHEIFSKAGLDRWQADALIDHGLAGRVVRRDFIVPVKFSQKPTSAALIDIPNQPPVSYGDVATFKSWMRGVSQKSTVEVQSMWSAILRAPVASETAKVFESVLPANLPLNQVRNRLLSLGIPIDSLEFRPLFEALFSPQLSVQGKKTVGEALQLARERAAQIERTAEEAVNSTAGKATAAGGSAASVVGVPDNVKTVAGDIPRAALPLQGGGATSSKKVASPD